MTLMQFISYSILGLITGLISGMAGVGGGVIIVPALVLLFGFSQKMAQGTSITMFILPIGLAAVIKYWQAGNVNIKVSLILALFYVVGSYVSAGFAQKIDEKILKNFFALLMIIAAFNMLDLKDIFQYIYNVFK